MDNITIGYTTPQCDVCINCIGYYLEEVEMTEEEFDQAVQDGANDDGWFIQVNNFESNMQFHCSYCA